jgi:hypothetical protein
MTLFSRLEQRCRLTTPDSCPVLPGAYGTGFFVTPRAVLTNKHVLTSRRLAKQSHMLLYYGTSEETELRFLPECQCEGNEHNLCMRHRAIWPAPSAKCQGWCFAASDAQVVYACTVIRCAPPTIAARNVVPKWCHVLISQGGCLSRAMRVPGGAVARVPPPAGRGGRLGHRVMPDAHELEAIALVPREAPEAVRPACDVEPS